MTTHTIDATEKALGRTASAAAVLLMGKNEASFENNQLSKNKVIIKNASKAKISLKKLDTKLYEKYSGYPGGFSEQKMSKVIERKGYEEIFRLAVYGMLPANKLRPKMMKNLQVID